MTSETIADQLKQLPNQPGVYRYFDAADNLLYVGKAVNLKRRVSSYFQRPQERRISDLVERINRIEVATTDSAIEALFLEAYLINTLQPPYNVRQKDDKTFVQIGLTKELYPRVITFRATQKVKTDLLSQFGPYTSAELARTALAIVRKIIPFRTNCQPGTSGRGCLDYQLGLCPGPCAGLIKPSDYRKLVTKLILFFQGKKQALARQLEREMKAAANNQQFELASNLRNQLFALHHIRDVALIRKAEFDQLALERTVDSTDQLLRRLEGYDISNIASDHAVGSMVVITDGKPDKAEYRKFLIKTVIGQNDLKMMEEMLTRRLRHTEWPLPSLLVIDGGANHLRIAQRVTKKARLTIPIIAVAKGPERKKLDLYPSAVSVDTTEPKLRAALQLTRDEAHRFAIQYHRKRRDKAFMDNLIDTEAK